jgi:hypothetical protein
MVNVKWWIKVIVRRYEQGAMLVCVQNETAILAQIRHF